MHWSASLLSAMAALTLTAGVHANGAASGPSGPLTRAQLTSTQLSPQERMERTRAYAWSMLKQKGRDCRQVTWTEMQKDSSILAVCTSQKSGGHLRYKIEHTNRGPAPQVDIRQM